MKRTLLWIIGAIAILVIFVAVIGLGKVSGQAGRELATAPPAPPSNPSVQKPIDWSQYTPVDAPKK